MPLYKVRENELQATVAEVEARGERVVDVREIAGSVGDWHVLTEPVRSEGWETRA